MTADKLAKRWHALASHPWMDPCVSIDRDEVRAVAQALDLVSRLEASAGLADSLTARLRDHAVNCGLEAMSEDSALSMAARLLLDAANAIESKDADFRNACDVGRRLEALLADKDAEISGLHAVFEQSMTSRLVIEQGLNEKSRELDAAQKRVDELSKEIAMWRTNATDACQHAAHRPCEDCACWCDRCKQLAAANAIIARSKAAVDECVRDREARAEWISTAEQTLVALRKRVGELESELREAQRPALRNYGLDDES